MINPATIKAYMHHYPEKEYMKYKNKRADQKDFLRAVTVVMKRPRINRGLVAIMNFKS